MVLCCCLYPADVPRLACHKQKPLNGFRRSHRINRFFITHGFKQNAEEQERRLMGGDMSDISKIFYLEVIDATFSIDGVLGAFAFTLSVPLILIGNGLGAFVVRKITIGNIEKIKKYKYLKNGAMYSILCLGVIMIADSFNMHIPAWLRRWLPLQWLDSSSINRLRN